VRIATTEKETELDTGKGHPNRRIIMFIILIGIAMAVIDGVVVAIALPTMTSYFGVPVAESQWVITAYLITETSLLLVFGKVAEYLGKTRLFMAGFALFTGSSLACGLSVALPPLILFRIIQATGAAMVFSISSAIIFEIFPKGEQGMAMGYIGATIAIASIAAPMLGGFITDAIGWQYIFLINVPIGIVLLILGFKYLKIEETRSSNLRMDWPGAAAMITGMGSLILLLGEFAQNLGVSGPILLYSAICIGALFFFLLRERKTPNPLLDLTIFRNSRFTLANISMILLFVAIFMINIIGPFYFEGVMGLNPSQVGLVFLIAPLIMVIAAPITGWIFDKYQYRFMAAAGITLSGISLLYLSYAARTMDLIMIVIGFIPLAIGNALFQSPNNTEIMRALPLEKIGVASSVSATIRNLGMTLGVSFSSILITFLLKSGGYVGPVIDADPILLASSIGIIMIIGAALCFMGTGVSIIRNTGPD
jgi:EmrB/QacA subfamily drug resistance transporter